MSELVVFTERENFDFFKFSSRVPAKQQEALKADCIMVQETQKLTAQTFGVWALRLVDLRDCGCWEDVINPETGFAFYNEGFGAFCKHAFGLSETATSNLTKVAQFIQNHGDNVGALDERYRGYSFSQLVELSSVSPSNRQYFSSDMTVKEMRTAKDYMKNSSSFGEEKDKEGFDLLAKAQAWKDNGRKTPAPKSEVIPGQIELEDISDSVKVNINPTSELANDGEEDFSGELTEEKKERAIKKALIEQAGRNRRKEIYDKYKENPTHNKFVQFIKDSYGRSGFIVDGISGDADAYGYSIRFIRHNWTLLFSWAQVTSLIVGFINRGEYYTEENVIPTSQVVNDGEEEEEPEYIQDGGTDTDDYDELDEAQADMQTIEEESERSLPPVEEKTRYNFYTRTGVRAFLKDCLDWKKIDCSSPFIGCYCYTLKNKRRIYVYVQRTANKDGIDYTYGVIHRYFFDLPQYSNVPVEITKEQFEEYCAEHKDEL